MKEHGLLYRGAMIRALQDGRKRATRRPVTRQNALYVGMAGSYDFAHGLRDRASGCQLDEETWDSLNFDRAGAEGEFLIVPQQCSNMPMYLLPRFEQGDRIWARETWNEIDHGKLVFAADGNPEQLPMRSGMFLNRHRTRLVHEISAAPYPQRVADMTAAERAAEGFPIPDSDPEGPCSFEDYWKRIHGDAPGTQWVWAYTGLTPVLCERCKARPPRRLEPTCGGCTVSYQDKSA